MLNLSVLLEDSSRTYPHRTALVLGESRLSYAEVNAAANRVANLLTERGIGAGDTVALSCPNIPWFPIVYYGILKTGATVVPLNVLLKAREVAYHLRDSQARVYFCFEGTDDLPMGAEGERGFSQVDGCDEFFLITADPAASSPFPDTLTLGQAIHHQPTTFDTHPTEATDTAVVLYTSGTTGQPKGAELTHANIVLNALAAHRTLAAGEASDVHLIALPLFHSLAQTVQMHTGFAGAATLVLLPRFDPNTALQLMLREQVTHFAGVPTMYHALLGATLEEPDRARIAESLHLAVSGGAALPVAVIDGIREQFGVKVLEGYGLSETSPAVAFTPRNGENRPGSIGMPIWGVELKLIHPDGSGVPEDPTAVGEIAIKGHPVMKGYLRRPEATAQVLQDGWFRTGDLARRDADGYYYVVDRAKDMIIRGGYNVYPRELEEVLITHPAVSLVAVIGVPHEALGEEVKAVVQLEPGAVITTDELLAWGREQFAAYKYPRLIEFTDALALSATGKILKRELSANRPQLLS